MATTKKPAGKAGKKRKVEKVMDEFKHGDLKSGKDGKGGAVTSRKQAIAIALSESGQSRGTKKAPGKKKSATQKKA